MKDTTHYKIDFLVPYVNNLDIVWRDNFIKYCRLHNLNNKIVSLLGSRYGGIDFLYNQLRLVNKNMPWINNIYLIVSNKEQIIPSLLPKNVIVVYHHDFIPYVYLPTFNSCTIEMFIWNIKGLSEHFIYANDDMLPTGKLEPTDFFDFNKNKIKIEWRNDLFSPNMTVYAYQCKNNCVSMLNRFDKTFDGNMLRPVHSFTPMIKSHCRDAFYLIKDDILKHIRAFRTEYQHNQYIYPLYEYYKYGTLDSNIDFLYTELNEDFDLNHQICCINCEGKKQYVEKYKEEIKKLCE